MRAISRVPASQFLRVTNPARYAVPPFSKIHASYYFSTNPATPTPFRGQRERGSRPHGPQSRFFTSYPVLRYQNLIDDDDYFSEAVGHLRNFLNGLPPDWPRKWGWVVYRTAYDEELDAGWAALQGYLKDGMERSYSGPFSNDILETRDFLFVEDKKKLEGLPRQVLRENFFKPLIRVEAPGVENFPGIDRGARYEYFLHADEDSLRSVMCLPNKTGTKRLPPYVNIVEAIWDEHDQERHKKAYEPDADDFDPFTGPGDIQRLGLSGIDLEDYVDLNSHEWWWIMMRFTRSSVVQRN